MLRFSRFLVLFVLSFFTLGICAQGKPYFKKGNKLYYSNWKLVYNDNFNKKTTILKNWVPQNGAPEHIISSRWESNLAVRRGKLIIQNKKELKGGKEWTTGAMYCRSNFCYGYYECRMKISKSEGVNNSFWMSAGRKTGLHAFEIDFAEVHYPNIIYYTIHDYGEFDSSQPQSEYYVYKPDMDLSEDYHIYGVSWEENRLGFYFDGVLVWEVMNCYFNHPGPMCLGTAVLKWAGDITESINGTNMLVDYVRVWEQL